VTARVATGTSLSPARGDEAAPHSPPRLGPGLGLIFGVSTWTTALRPLGSLPHGGPLVCVYSAGLAVACAILWRLDARTLERACRRLGHPIALGTVLAGLCLFNAAFFAWNNSLKAVGSDSTGDDAIIEAFAAFAAGLPMYSAQLYDGSPISPGPLWVLLNGWLAPLGAHFLMTPLYLVAVWTLIDPARRGAFTALMLLNPLVWTTSGTGHDHVAIGLAFVACLIWARRASSAWSMLGLSLAGAVLGTSRVVYAGVPLLLALCATSSTPRARWTSAGLGTLLTLATHAIFSAQAAPYQPAHLFQRGLNNTGIPLMLLGGAGALFVLALAWRQTSSHLASPHWFAGTLLVPHAAVALGELLSVHGDVPRWEGANYLLPALPALAYAWLRASPSFSTSRLRAPDPES
jgi:hypothetical protein